MRMVGSGGKCKKWGKCNEPGDFWGKTEGWWSTRAGISLPWSPQASEPRGGGWSPPWWQHTQQLLLVRVLTFSPAKRWYHGMITCNLIHCCLAPLESVYQIFNLTHIMQGEILCGPLARDKKVGILTRNFVIMVPRWWAGALYAAGAGLPATYSQTGITLTPLPLWQQGFPLPPTASKVYFLTTLHSSIIWGFSLHLSHIGIPNAGTQDGPMHRWCCISRQWLWQPD